jgi:hypothetical protein
VGKKMGASPMKRKRETWTNRKITRTVRTTRRKMVKMRMKQKATLRLSLMMKWW